MVLIDTNIIFREFRLQQMKNAYFHQIMSLNKITLFIRK